MEGDGKDEKEEKKKRDARANMEGNSLDEKGEKKRRKRMYGRR